MKIYYLFFLLLVGSLIFIISHRPENEIPQSQEEAPMAEQLDGNSFRIILDIKTEKDNSIADIIWFKKAAKFALDQKIPWFNVLEQKISADSVEGIIKLEPDPLRAEYDAHEILNLELVDEVAE